jgi:HAD superfamily hydrolase (TIGR01509 family)
MSLPRPVQAVVFDMDGLLVDTEVLYREAMSDAAASLGHELPQEVFLRMVGLTEALSRQVLLDHFGEDFDVDRYWQETIRLAHQLTEAGVCLKAGVVELLDHLDLVNAPRAVCTSSPHWAVERNLGPHGLLQRFQAVVAKGDYAHGKPHPDPFLKAAERLGVEPQHCLALEDSHNGIRAAHAAGMMAIMVPDLLHPTEEIRGLCVRIAETLHEVIHLIPAKEQA